MIINKLKKWWQSLRFYVIADPADNSITLSKHLLKHMQNHATAGGKARVFVFTIKATGNYGFIVDPKIECDKPTQMCDIQYNEKFKCIGFETLCPSVGSIFYRYNLPDDKRVKLSVSVHNLPIPSGIYYIFDRPDEKHIRKHT